MGGLGTSSLAQAAAFLSSETGLTVSALPAIEEAASPFTGSASFALGTAYKASLLTNSAAPVAGAPTISEWTRSGNPGDSIVLTGANLGNNLHVFVYAQQAGGDAVLAEATVVSSEGGDAVVTLPAGLPSSGVYTLWASNSAGFGDGVLLNAPEVWWVGSNAVAPGTVTSIYGRNLVLPNGAKPSVVLEMTSGPQAGATFVLPVVQSTPYRVDVSVPGTVPDGTYELFLNNSGGGDASWSQTQGIDLTVRAALAHDWAGSDSAVIYAHDYGAVAGDGKDDAAAIQNAINAARAIVASGGPIHEVTVQLDAGTYDISQSIFTEDGVNLQGAGVGKTTLEPTAAFAKSTHLIMLWADASTSTATATGSRIGNLTITTNGGAGYTAIWGRSSQHMTVDSVAITAMNGTPFDVHASDHFTLSNSQIVGPESFIGSASQITIHDNAFYGTNQTGENIGGFGASDVSLYNNTAQNLDPNPTASTWQADTYLGRFYVDETQYGQPVNQYIAGNKTSGLGPYVEYAAQGVNTNSGEQILYEGAGASTSLALGNGLFKSSTATSLTLSHAVTIASAVGTGALLTVASGTGAGATTEVTGYNAATATFTFADPLAVPLDATSTIILSRAPNQIAIVGNTLDGRAQDVAPGVETASVGVQVYPGGARFAIDGNTFSDLNAAVNLWSFPATEDDKTIGGDNSLIGVNFFDIKNNTVVNSNVGVQFYDDPGGAADLNEPAAILYPHQAIGTTIRNNDLSGVHDYSLGFDTRQATSVDIAAANVASGNTLAANAIAGGAGFDGGSPNLVILYGQAATPAQRLQTAEALQFSNIPRYFGTAAEPAFQATFGTSGSILLDQVSAVAGTLNGQAALIATAGAGDDIGFTSDSTDPRLQVLHGGGGDDILIGSAGANDLFGDAGNDILAAGAGTLQMTGGTGADTFVLDPALPSTALTITDFNAAEGDTIVIEATLPAGVDPVAGGYLQLAARSGGTAVLFDANGGGNSFVQLALVDGAVSASNVAIGFATTTTTMDGDLAVTFGTNSPVAGVVNAAHASNAAFSIGGVDAGATATVTLTGTALAGGPKTLTLTGAAAANGAHTVDLSGFQDGTVTAAISAVDLGGAVVTGTGASTRLDHGPAVGKVSPTLNVGTTTNLTSQILSAATPGLVGDALTITSDTAAGTLGTVTLTAGALTYAATTAALSHIPANGSATDSFAYTIADPYGNTATGTATVTVANPATVINGPSGGYATIQGTAGADVIAAFGSGNTIHDNGGNDVVNAGRAASVDAGGGDVVVNLNGTGNVVTGTDGNDAVSGSKGTTSVTLGNGADMAVLGGTGNLIRLGNGNDTVTAGSGRDMVLLGNGNDRITLAGGNNTVMAGNGNDTISGGTGNAVITLGSGNNSVTTSGRNNQYVLNGGNDMISGGQGGETYTASGGQHTLTLHGSGEHVILNDGASATIADLGTGLHLDIGSSQGTDVVSGLAQDTTAVIDLLHGAGGFTSVNQVVQALQSDGHGGTVLSLGSSGSIDFTGTTALRAANFKVG